MKKYRIISLLLSIIMMFGIMAPAAFAAEDANENKSTSVPYRFRSELVNEKENKVKIWLELDSALAENIASYQIAVRLQNMDSDLALGREMTLEFDAALKAAKVQSTRYDKDKQILRIYVAGTQNLVQTSTSSANILPIGIVTVEKTANAAQNAFKILPSGNDGELTVVDLGLNVKKASEAYTVPGEVFVIPADGEVYGDVNTPDPETTTTTKPEEPTTKPGGSTNKCSCLCHKKTPILKFIYRIMKFFWKIFGKNPVCECGKAHY